MAGSRHGCIKALFLSVRAYENNLDSLVWLPYDVMMICYSQTLEEGEKPSWAVSRGGSVPRVIDRGCVRGLDELVALPRHQAQHSVFG